jgi:predicted phage tail component-like protein
MGIVVQEVSRPLLPQLADNEIKVADRHGSYDMGNNTYENRIIEVSIGFKEDTRENRILKSRQIASWLSQKGELIFDDEKDVHYIGRVYSSIPLETAIRMGKCKLIFNCEPFAYSSDVVQQITVTQNNFDINVSNDGTIETPFRIRFKNVGTQPITHITILKVSK